MPDQNIMTRAEMWERHAAIGKLPDGDQMAAYHALHREYFGAYVKAFGIKAPQHLLPGCRKALAAGDEHMNSPYTRLEDWDAAQHRTRSNPALQKALYANGEGWSLSVNICLLKEAARQQIEAER